MDKFLQLNPSFTGDARLFKIIAKKTVFKNIQGLESRLSVLKLPVIKELLNNNFYDSEEIKCNYRQVIEKEGNEIEKIIYRILCMEYVEVADMEVRMLLYKEFPTQRGLILDATTSMHKLQDLLFREVYMHENKKEEIEKTIQNASFTHKVFYILAMKGHTDVEFVKRTVFRARDTQVLIKQDEGLTDTVFSRYVALALRAIPEKEFYAVVTSELVYSPVFDKVQMFRSVTDLVDHERLVECVVKECFVSSNSTVKSYIVFLKIFELVSVPQEFKIRIFYSWLRYFFMHGCLDLFTNLICLLKSARKKDEEFEFYVGVLKCMKGGMAIEELRGLSGQARSEDGISGVTAAQIVEKCSSLVD